MLTDIHQYIEQGGKLLAKCGGMMYLCNSITEMGVTYPMAGALKQSATMENTKLRLGYRTLYYKGYKIRGHEFHYSSIRPQRQPLPSVAEAFTAKGTKTETSLYSYKNCCPDIRIEANGTLDELNALIGIIRGFLPEDLALFCEQSIDSFSDKMEDKLHIKNIYNKKSIVWQIN